MTQHKSRFVHVTPPRIAINESPPFADWGVNGSGFLDLTQQVGEVVVAKAFNRTGAATAAGDLLAFDLTATQAETTEGQQPFPFEEDSAWRNLIVPGAAAITRGVFAVALEVAADNAELWVCVRGVVQAFALDSLDTTIDAGDMLVPDVVSGVGTLNSSISATGSVLAGDNTAYIRIAHALVDQTVVTDTKELTWVRFDGFGLPYAVSPDQT